MLGVFGGTFDPVHFGHLRTACEAREALGLARVHMVPAARPPHRDPASAPAEQRLALLEAALAGHEGLVADDREVRRDGPSYTVDTLESLRAEHPGEGLCLIVGLDAYAGLAGWHRWERLLELAHLAVLRRPGVTLDPGGIPARLLRERGVEDPRGLAAAAASGKIAQVSVTQLDISASRLRGLLAAGRPADFLLPDPVLGLILDRGLYAARRRSAP